MDYNSTQVATQDPALSVRGSWRTLWVVGCSLLAWSCYDSNVRPIVAPADSAADSSLEHETDPDRATSNRAGGVSAECDPEAADWSVACAAPGGAPLYQGCPGGIRECGEVPNTSCASYTQSSANAFCASYCDVDEDCPRPPGYGAACNFVACALLCDDGRCPAGMFCVADFAFIDRDGHARGQKSVCVPDA